MSFKLINEEQDFFSGRAAKGTKQVRDETPVGVRQCAGLSVNLLENGDHLGGQLTYIIVMLRPEGYFIELLLEMTDFNDSFGFGDLKHRPKQDQTAVSNITGLLVLEQEIMLVCEEGLVGSGGYVVLENVEDQLIDDSELDEPDVVRGRAVEPNDSSIDSRAKRSIELHVVSSIEPLGKALAVVGGDLRPMHEQIDECRYVDFHDGFAAREHGGRLVKEAIPVDGDQHERAPAIVLTLVLEKLQKHCGHCHRDVEANVVAGRG